LFASFPIFDVKAANNPYGNLLGSAFVNSSTPQASNSSDMHSVLPAIVAGKPEEGARWIWLANVKDSC